LSDLPDILVMFGAWAGRKKNKPCEQGMN
jgi:hypothetical protein